MDIIIGKGLDSLHFGLSKDRVAEMFGAADKSYEHEHGDLCHEYHSRQISIDFDPEEEYGISWISVKNKDARLQDQYLWSKSKQDIIALLEEMLEEVHVFEDYGSLESVNFEDHSLELQFTLGRLSAINIGFLFDAEGNIIL